MCWDLGAAMPNGGNVKLNLAGMAICLLLSSATACGGASTIERSSMPVDLLRQQAMDRKAEAIALADVSSCARESQCAVLTFESPDPGCTQFTKNSYKAYLLTSPTVHEAEAAAAGQRSLAAQTRKRQPPLPHPCPAITVIPPVAVCIASRCVLRSAVTGELFR